MLSTRSQKIIIETELKKIITRRTTYSDLLNYFELEHACSNCQRKVDSHARSKNLKKNKEKHKAKKHAQL